MATVLTEKKVLFSGIWKPSAKASPDALLRQISEQFLVKKSLISTYQFCTDGLRLIVIHDNGRQGLKSEKIPLSSIQDICANRYNPICLMTIYTDSQRRTNYLVCRCESETDASQIVLTFREYKKSLSGEGYKIDLVKPQGTNWTLMPKHDDKGTNGHPEVSSDSGGDFEVNGVDSENRGIQNGVSGSSHQAGVEVAAEALDREPCEIEGKPGFSVAVQTAFGEPDSDRDSMASSTSFMSLKEELMSLSQEIRAIKFILEKTGISASEYIKREGVVQYEGRTWIPITTDTQNSHAPLESPNDADKHVNFTGGFQDHDARSYGVQTETGRKGVFTKRQGRSEVRLAYSSRSGIRPRSHSSSSTAPRSPSGLKMSGSNEVFEVPSNHQRVYIRGTEPRAKAGHGTTIERPIEQVYTMYSKHFRNPRKKILVMPNGHNTMPALRRPKSSSQSSSMNDIGDGHYH